MKISGNLLLRTLTSIFLLLLVTWVFFLGQWALYSLIMSVALLSCWELLNIVNNRLFFLPLLIIIVIIPYSALAYIYSTHENIFIWLILCIWVTDISAYCAGKIVGGSKIFYKISPNKTWSGLIGGISLTAFFGLIFAYFLHLPYYFLFLGGLVTITAQLGDFFESSIKRMYKVNHSSNLLPGHGGILDRMDGIIFTTPIFALLLQRLL